MAPLDLWPEIENTRALRKGQFVHQKVDVSLFGNGSQRVPPLRVQQCDSMGEILPHMVCGVKMGPNYAVPLVEYSTTNGAHRLGMDAHQCTAPRREQPLFWKCAPYWLKRSSVGRSLLSTPAQHAIRARCATHLADAGDI